MTLDPNFILAWTALASQELNTFWFAFDPSPARLAKAKEALDCAEALAPDSPEVEMTRAEYLYHGLFDYTGAFDVLAKVQAKLPNNAHVWFLTALLDRRMGNMESAISHFARARELDPNDRNIIADGNATLVFTGRYDEARVALDRDLKRAEDTGLLYELRLITEWNDGGLDAADRFLSSLPSESGDVLHLRAWQALFRRDFPKASALFEQAIAQGGNHHTQLIFDGYIPSKVGWLLQQALSEARRGDAAKSTTLYRQAQELARAQLAAGTGSKNTEAGWHAALGMTCAGLGQASEAVAEGKAATALIPLAKDKWEGPDWLGLLTQIYAMNGDAEHAAPLIEQLIGTTANITPALLSFDPVWDPIRKDARF